MALSPRCSLVPSGNERFTAQVRLRPNKAKSDWMDELVCWGAASSRAIQGLKETGFSR